jgi:BTB/POZ domain
MVSGSNGLGWDAMGGAPGNLTEPGASTQDQCVSIVQALASETNEALYDVTVRVGDRSFPAHRAILAAQSPVFRAMFTSGMREQQSGCIELGDVAPHVFAVMLRYAYGGGLMDEPPDVLVHVSELADRMQMDTLQARAACFLTRGTFDELPSLRSRWWGPPVRQAPSSSKASDAASSHLIFGDGIVAVTGFTLSPPPVINNHGQAFKQQLDSVSGPGLAQSSGDSIRLSGGLPTDAPHPVAFLARELGIALESETFLKFPFTLLARILASDSLVMPERWLFDSAMCMHPRVS